MAEPSESTGFSGGFGAAPFGLAAAKLQTVPLPPLVEALAQAPVNPCFGPGTHILTEFGETAVTALTIGDEVILAEGDTAPITWIGWRDIDLTRHVMPGLVRPVRIAAGALAMGVPERELILSPDHGLYFDGSLVQAKDLIDGVVITQDFTTPHIRYYHVELPAHGILLAEGAACESYLDTGHRGVFNNAAAPLLLHPDLMQIRRQAKSVAPLVTSGDELAAVRAQLHARKLMLGYGVTESPQLALKIGENLQPPSEIQPGQISFDIPAGAQSAILASPVFVPAEIDPASNDRRCLGVAITEIWLDGKTTILHEIAEPNDLHKRAPRETATWTRGAVRLKFPAGAKKLTLLLAGLPKLWTDERMQKRG